MASPGELTQYIRFQLERLSERNAHHEFEHLCRRVTAARIASNILPATGPVSGGGDQGRDFETHPSALPQELGRGAPGSWLALASRERLAFACTIQRKDLRPKIEADVAAIMAEGERPDRVHAFVAGPISKAQRQKSIANVRERYGVELVVHDAVYLAEELSQPDLFWVAQRYLDVPPELGREPVGMRTEQPPEWYIEDRERWRTRDPYPTMGDLLDLTDGLRRATSDERARADLGFWLALVRPLAQTASDRGVRQMARYESSVAIFRGQRTLFPADDLVRDFFGEISSDDPPEMVKRASTLLQFTRNALMYRQTGIGADEVRSWRMSLLDAVDAHIQSESGPNRLAQLLATDGFMRLAPVFDERDIPVEPVEMPDTLRWKTREDVVADAPATVSAQAMFDPERGMASWLRLARMLDKAPLFDVNEFAALLSLVTPALIDHPDWPELTERVETTLAAQAGQAVVAERCRDRAIALRRLGRHRDAIHEMHRARLDWWSGNTLRGSLLSTLIMSDSYHQLGLAHAAAQCALTVAFAAGNNPDNDHRDLMGPALAMSARLEYFWGAWLGATELTEATVAAAALYREGGIDPSADFLKDVLVNAGLVVAAAPVLLGSEAGQAVNEALERIHLTELLGGDAVRAHQESGELSDQAEWDAAARGDLAGPPFQDVSDEYVLRFEALGVTWLVRADYPRNPKARRACERFAAAAQVLLLELSNADLCLIPTTVDVTIGVRGGGGSLDPRWRPGTNGRMWRFELGSADQRLDRQLAELLEALSLVIMDASLLPTDAYDDAITSAFERGLSHKLVFGRSYDELREAYADPGLRASIASAARVSAGESWHFPRECALERATGPGPTFSPEDATDLALGRYEKVPKRIPRQLDLLRSDGQFQIVIRELLERGWPEHLILLGVLNITLNERLHDERIDFSTREGRIRAEALTEHPESDDSPLVPASRFTVDALNNARRLALPATLSIWNLVCHAPTPDLDAIETLLADRYEYWASDADHDDILGVRPE